MVLRCVHLSSMYTYIFCLLSHTRSLPMARTLNHNCVCVYMYVCVCMCWLGAVHSDCGCVVLYNTVHGREPLPTLDSHEVQEVRRELSLIRDKVNILLDSLDGNAGQGGAGADVATATAANTSEPALTTQAEATATKEGWIHICIVHVLYSVHAMLMYTVHTLCTCIIFPAIVVYRVY